MDALFTEIYATFKREENEEVAKGMKAYMRGQFDYLGLSSPIRKALSKPIVAELSKEQKTIVYPLIKTLWNRPEREFHYLALDLYLKVAKKMMEEEDRVLLEWMICQHSWWDTIDFIAPKLVRIYFDKFPKKRDEIVDKWIKSGNVWLQRSSLLFQLKQKDEVDYPFMISTIERLTGSKEFFINKAIGWLLREHSKRIPLEIKAYIDSNQNQLSTLSVREGLKYC
jgi:3-methyladenine DNA glycosylase AlkD